MTVVGKSFRVQSGKYNATNLGCRIQHRKQTSHSCGGSEKQRFSREWKFKKSPIWEFKPTHPLKGGCLWRGNTWWVHGKLYLYHLCLFCLLSSRWCSACDCYWSLGASVENKSWKWSREAKGKLYYLPPPPSWQPSETFTFNFRISYKSLLFPNLTSYHTPKRILGNVVLTKLTAQTSITGYKNSYNLSQLCFHVNTLNVLLHFTTHHSDHKIYINIYFDFCYI